MRIALAADHGGYQLKDLIAEDLRSSGHEIVDLGVHDQTSVDYPDQASLACAAVVGGDAERAILVCGTGIGMSIAANKVPGIRAALVSDAFSARMSRAHNDAQVMCLGARVVGPSLATELARAFVEASFEGGRHQRRLDKITAIANTTEEPK